MFKEIKFLLLTNFKCVLDFLASLFLWEFSSLAAHFHYQRNIPLHTFLPYTYNMLSSLSLQENKIYVFTNLSNLHPPPFLLPFVKKEHSTYCLSPCPHIISASTPNCGSPPCELNLSSQLYLP